MGETRLTIFLKVHRRSREFVAEFKRNYIYSAINSRVHKLYTLKQSLLIDFTHLQNVNIILYKNKEYKVQLFLENSDV